jgi:hypothetical protein
MPTSTTSREQFSEQQQRATEASRRGQDELHAATRAWGNYIHVLMNTMSGHRRGEAALAEMIDGWFEMTHHVLEAQRQFTRSLLPMTTPVLDATYSAAEEATRATREAVRTTTTSSREASSREASSRESPGARKDS